MDLKEVFKNKKVLLASMAVLLVAGGAVGSKVYADNQKAQEQARIAEIKEKQQAEEKQLKLDAENSVNGLFEKAIIDNKEADKVAIKNDLKSEVVKETKTKFYIEKTKDDWQQKINKAIINAENQLKQIDTAKKALEKVYKDNKVVNTDQKNFDSAKKEIDKIKNAKTKKELSDKLAKVKAEIDKQNKEKEAKKKEAEKQAESTNDLAKENATVKTDNAVETATNANNQQEQAVQDQQPQGEVPANQNYAGQDTANNNWQAPAETPSNNQQEQPAPPATGGGSTGGQTTTPPVTPPTQPEQPSGPPAGFMEPPFPIGSGELIDWLADNGYSGYWSSGGYIQPY